MAKNTYNKERDDLLHQVIMDSLSRIEGQTIKTNGRVKWLEKSMFGAFGALLILSPLCSWFILDYLKFKESLTIKIETAVGNALEDYEFEIAP